MEGRKGAKKQGKKKRRKEGMREGREEGWKDGVCKYMCICVCHFKTEHATVGLLGLFFFAGCLFQMVQIVLLAILHVFSRGHATL